MPRTFRVFETEVDCTMEEALQIIRAALDDEGLALGPRGAREDGVTSVIVGGRKQFRVLDSRILSIEQDAAARAAFTEMLERGGLVGHAE